MDRTSSRARRLMVALAAAGLLAAIPATATATKVNIYLTRGAKLQMIERTLPTGADKLTYSVRTLFVGATKTERDDGVVSRIPKGTKLYSVVVRDRVAYVRVGTAFAASGTGSQIKVRFGQLVYTVLQYKQVDAVRVLLDDEVMPPADAIDSALLDHGSVPKLDIIPPLPVGVRAVQQSLAKLKYLPLGAVNGSLDYRTSQALLAFQGWEGLLRTGTPTVETRLRLTTARIPTPRRRTTARRMEVTRWKGVLLEIENKKVRRVVHVSTGAGGRTPAGTFSVFRKERMSWSNPFSVWLPWASYFHAGYAFHQYPYVPGYPASHGCIRVSSPEAKGVYDFASFGTPVSVV